MSRSAQSDTPLHGTPLNGVYTVCATISQEEEEAAAKEERKKQTADDKDKEEKDRNRSWGAKLGLVG